MNKPLLIGIVAVVVAVASALILIHHSSPAIIINAPYAFIINSNDQWEIIYFDPSGNMHVVGQYSNLNDPDILNAMNVVSSFNQQVVPQHSSYQPLDSIIVVGANDTGKQGVVVIPVSGNTIELKDINPGYYTLVAVPQQYASQFMQALDTGYKLSAIVSAQGLQYLQYHNPQIWKLVLETIDLQQYAPQYFGGSNILETNNNTLIPWAYLGSTSSTSLGYNLQFIKSNIPYNGS